MSGLAASWQSDLLARDIYERAKPSLVDVYVRRARDGTEFHTLGVVAEAGGVTAWSGLDTAGGKWENLSAITIRQGTQEWRGEMHSMRKDWCLCAVTVRDPFPLPAIPWRRSNTLALGDRLLYVIAGEDETTRRVGWTQLIDVVRSGLDSYDRAFIWTTELDRTMPREYAFAFDNEGRVAGLVEPLPELANQAVLLAGEWVGGLVQRCWTDTLLQSGELRQLCDEYREGPSSYGAEALCAVATAFLRLGDLEGSCDALQRAIAKDPLNPWPLRTLGHLLASEGRIDEADPLMQLAEKLEAEAPRGASV